MFEKICHEKKNYTILFYVYSKYEHFLFNCYSTMPKRRVKSDPQAQASARRQRQTRSPVTPAQPEPIDRKPLSTNVGYAQPTKPTSDCQMFNEVKLKQLTDHSSRNQHSPHQCYNYWLRDDLWWNPQSKPGMYYCFIQVQAHNPLMGGQVNKSGVIWVWYWKSDYH